MATIILGGAPEGNWLPLLLPLVILLAIVAGGDYLKKVIRERKARKNLITKTGHSGDKNPNS